MNKPIIKVGDRVRSYDFPDLPGMKTTCYVEGVVEAIGPFVGEAGPYGCDRYTIRIERRVWQRKEDEKWKEGREFPTGRVYPPVNGIPTSLGGITRGVEVLPPEPQPAPAPDPDQPDPQLTWASLESVPFRQFMKGRRAMAAKLEAYMRDKGWPYVCVDEARKAIFGASQIKAFDFLVYSSNGPNLLVLIVTRRPTSAQVEQMREWEKVFGAGFRAAFTFQAGGAWRIVSLQDLQAFDPLGQSRPLEECVSETPTNEGSNQ